MKVHRRTIAAAAILVSVLLAGCASSTRATSAPRVSGDPVAPMAAGMRMPDGSIMGAAAALSPSSAAAAPSASALMVCSPEIRSDVTKAAGLAAAPKATSTFVDHLFTCTYALPKGTFVVSVKDLASLSATTTYFGDLRHRLGMTATLAGLTANAFATPAGTVVLSKDSHVLEVDASHLPAVFGNQGEKRADFAYEIASDILGCWTNG